MRQTHESHDIVRKQRSGKSQTCETGEKISKCNGSFLREKAAQARGNSGQYRPSLLCLSGFTQGVLALGPRLAHDANGAPVGRDRGDLRPRYHVTAWAQYGRTVCDLD